MWWGRVRGAGCGGGAGARPVTTGDLYSQLIAPLGLPLTSARMRMRRLHLLLISLTLVLPTGWLQR